MFISLQLFPLGYIAKVFWWCFWFKSSLIFAKKSSMYCKYMMKNFCAYFSEILAIFAGVVYVVDMLS